MISFNSMSRVAVEFRSVFELVFWGFYLCLVCLSHMFGREARFCVGLGKRDFRWI